MKISIAVIAILSFLTSATVSYLITTGYDLNKDIFTKLFEKEQASDENDVLLRQFTAEEIELLEKIVMAEARGEPLEGQIAVVNVILNRVDSPYYPDTIEEVVFQKGQFTPTWDGTLINVKEINESVKKAVDLGIAGHQEVPKDTLFFLNEEIATDFTVPQTKKIIKKIGNHSFYK